MIVELKPAASRFTRLLEAHTESICRGLIAAMMLCGLGYSVYLGEQLRYPDERDFLSVADSLCEARVYSRDGGATPTAYRAPGYPLFLATFRCFGTPILWLRLLGFAALGGAAWFAGRAVARDHGAVARVLLTAAVAFYPLHLYTASTFYPQTLAMLGFTILLDRIAQVQRSADISWSSCLAVGVTGAVLILTVPPMIPALGIGLLALWSRSGANRRRLVVAGLGILVCVGAWTARNMAALGEPVLFSTNSGYNLALGNSPNTLASSGVAVDIEEWRAGALGRSEVERDRYFREAALGWIGRNPGAAAWLYVRKLAHFFAPTNSLATATEQGSARDALMYLTYGPAAILAAVALLLAATGRRALSGVERAGALAMFATATVYALFFTRLRFRVPVEPALLMLASTYIAERVFAADKPDVKDSPRV